MVTIQWSLREWLPNGLITTGKFNWNVARRLEDNWFRLKQSWRSFIQYTKLLCKGYCICSNYSLTFTVKLTDNEAEEKLKLKSQFIRNVLNRRGRALLHVFIRNLLNGSRNNLSRKLKIQLLFPLYLYLYYRKIINWRIRLNKASSDSRISIINEVIRMYKFRILVLIAISYYVFDLFYIINCNIIKLKINNFSNCL